LHKIVSSAAQINKADYVYNNVGNRTSLTDRRGVQNFGYDGLDRLTQASHPLLLTPQAFVYDVVGNRTTGGSVVNAANQLTADATHSYQYDDNGNLTRKTLLANRNYTSYTYDAENRLIRVDEFAFGASTPFATSTYRYDGLGRRIEKVGNGITRRYIYDAEDILLEYDETNTLQARYTRGPGIDEPLAMTRGGATFFYHQDGLGTVTDLTDSSGATAQSYAYDAWGNLIQQTSTLENPYTYTGREFDTETGLYYYRARYYDPNTGRFNREDPLFAGKPFPSINPKSSHLYTYALNNPTTVTDPSGLEPCPDLGISEYGLVKTLQVILEALGKKVGAIGGLSLEVGEASVVAAQGIVPLIERNRKLNQAVEASGLSKADIEYGGYFRKTVQESWIIKLYIKLSK